MFLDQRVENNESHQHRRREYHSQHVRCRNARLYYPERQQLVVASIIRAGLPLQKGLCNFFDHAETAFVAAYRKYGKGDYFEIRSDYCTTTEITGKTLVLADTMLATGSSVEVSLKSLISCGGEPVHTHLVCPIASSYAVDHLMQIYGDEVTLWTAAIDEELTSHSYIVPGLGDAGDLAFGGKL